MSLLSRTSSQTLRGIAIAALLSIPGAFVSADGDVPPTKARPRRVDAPQSPQPDWTDALVAAANERTRHRVTYDGRYRRLDYPGGDVPGSIGVCTDVVIRAYRALGIDLQREVHEDMQGHFSAYPSHWGLTRPDPNIDHRRVPNLRVFFTRHGESLPVTSGAADYQPGDLVTWMLDGRLPHIGFVVDGRSPDGRRPLIVHNVGRGPRKEDVLFDYPITGHYRFPRDTRDGGPERPHSGRPNRS